MITHYKVFQGCREMGLFRFDITDEAIKTQEFTPVTFICKLTNDVCSSKLCPITDLINETLEDNNGQT